MLIIWLVVILKGQIDKEGNGNTIRGANGNKIFLISYWISIINLRTIKLYDGNYTYGNGMAKMKGVSSFIVEWSSLFGFC